MFYPANGLCKAEPNGVHWILFAFYCGKRRVFCTFNLLVGIRRFKILTLFNLRMGWDGLDGMGWDGWDVWDEMDEMGSVLQFPSYFVRI